MFVGRKRRYDDQTLPHFPFDEQYGTEIAIKKKYNTNTYSVIISITKDYVDSREMKIYGNFVELREYHKQYVKR